jgi:hypothetical protein
MAVLSAETASQPAGMRSTALTEVVWERFAEDPMVSHSAQFPLGRAGGSVDLGSCPFTGELDVTPLRW